MWERLNYLLTRELDREGDLVGYSVRVSSINNCREYEQGDFSGESIEDLASDVITSEKNFLPIKTNDAVVTLPSYRVLEPRVVDKVSLEDSLRFRGLLEEASIVNL